MRGPTPKQFILIEGKPLLAHTIQRFEDCAAVGEVVVVVPSGKVDYCKREIVERFGFKKVSDCVEGGSQRQESVFRGLDGARGEIVCVHDGVRPAVTISLISECIETAKGHGAAIAAVPARDTIKRVEGMRIVATLKREELWEAQTPQVFRREFLVRAYDEAMKQGFSGTDEASLVERLGVPVRIVMGSYDNIKVASFDDLRIVEALLGKKN
jgi:2-C-methyl-D-erythritol 4-phosphate cytidylyltransferase